MALALCLTLLPATAQAADGHQTHPICGQNCSHNTDAGGTEHPENAFENAKGLSTYQGASTPDLMVDDGSADGATVGGDSGSDGWLLPEGTYYLKGGVTIDRPIVIRNKVTICLNGKTLQSKAENKPVFRIMGGELTLTNCKGTGKVIHNSSRGTGVQVESGGKFNLYGGTITQNNADYGGGVLVGSGTTFNMYGGSITNNTADGDKGYGGGGVCVKGGIFNMHDGTIAANKATDYTGKGNGGGVSVVNGGRFTMNDGTIGGTSADRDYNQAKGNGGGVYVSGSTFEMKGSASVAYNKAIKGNSSSGGDGGGVYVKENGEFIMHKTASVTGNTATNKGGGVYVSVSGQGSKFEMNDDASVTGNTTTGNQTGDNGNGGGVYMEKGTFDMNGNASVKNNETATKSYGGGVYVESSGTFNMNGGKTSVSENRAYNGGGVFVSNGTFAMNSTASVTKNKATQYGGVFVSDNATFTVSDRPTVTGNTKIGAGSADSNVHLAGSAYITIGGTLNEGASIGVTITNPNGVFATGVSTDCSGKFFSDDKTREVKYESDKLVLKNKETQPPTHEHKWTYTIKEGTKNTIVATCANTDTPCNDTNGGSVTITAPEHKTYGDGKSAKAQLTKANWQGEKVDVENIQYSTQDGADLDAAPTAVGKYKASITVGGKTAFVEYEITNGSTPAEKQDPEYSPPTPRAKLTYTSRPQELINAGHVTGGKMQYSLTSDGTYSDNLPTATNAGTYTVWYKVVGDNSHNNIEKQWIKVTIAKAPLSGTPTFTKVTGAGKTLQDVTLTKPKDWPKGTFEWGDGATKTDKNTPIVQGQAYSWYYSSANHSATGKIVPWANPSSSGGSSSGSSDSNPIIKTETKNNADGSTTKTETRKDGTVTATTTAKDGSVSKTETKKDGSSVTENKAADGSTGTIKTDKNGKTEMNAKVSAKAVENAKKSGEPVKAPVEVEASRNSNAAPTVKVELPQNSGKTEVEIPVSNASSGTVAVLVRPDGTEEILKASIPTENGIRLTVDGSATVKIVDNAKGFIDTQNHWAKGEIDFVSARELVNGVSATRYAPNATATRAQLWTILARQNDADLSGGANWYEKAQLWSKDKGISDGTEPNAAINRAQMVTMLWRTMGQPAATDKVSFADVPAGSYYAQAVAWAVESGITTGIGGGKFDPTATCTRAQIAAFLARSMK